MKKKNPLGLRVLSTAAIMSIVSSIAAPAFAGTYYLGNESTDIEIIANEDGSVTVKHEGKEYTDWDDEIIIKGGKGEDKEKNTATTAETTIGETEVTPVEEEPEEEEPVEEAAEETPAEKPEAEPEAVAEEQPEEAEAEPEESAEEEQPEEAFAAEEETPAEDAAKPEETEEAAEEPETEETVEKTDTEETPDEAAEETDDTEETADEDAEPAAEDETPAEDAGQPEETVDGETAPAEQEIADETAETPAEQQPEAAATQEAAEADTAVQAEEETTEEETPTVVDKVIKITNNVASSVRKTLKIILDNVHIDVSGGSQYRDGSAAMEVKGSGDVTLELNGENVLKSGTNRAGLEKNDQYVNGQKVSGTLTIQDEDKDGGSLEAVGDGYAAGIGSSSSDNGDATNTTSNISITGGKITATSGSYGGAGIGSGCNYTGKSGTLADNISITGGEINAESKDNGGAGIGSGRGGNVGTITIGGDAVVTAKGASKTYGGAGIGAGMCETDFNRYWGGDVDTITIEGNATIKEAIGGVGSAGIGAGSNGKAGLITIKDNASVVKAENNGSNGGGGAGIGGGSNWARNGAGSATIKIDTTGTGTVTISNGTVNAVSESGGAGIGGGYGGIGGAGRVTVTGGQIIRAKSGQSAGIGDGYSGSSGTVGENTSGNGFVKITGGKIGQFIKNAKCIWELVEGTGAIGGGNSAGIGGAGKYGSGEEFTKGNVTISGAPFIGALGGGSAPAIGNGNSADKKQDTMDVTDLDTTKVSVIKPKGEDANETWILPTASDHTWDEGKVTKAPTCAAKGEMTFTCKDCDATKTETIAVDPDAHDYTREEGEEEWDVIIPATCTTEGKKVKHCKNAPGEESHDLVETIPVDKTNHQHLTEGVNKKDPTCKEPGYTGDTVCDDCHETVKKGEEIPATGHENTHVEGKKEPTCEEPGYTGDEVCDKCGDVVKKGEDIPAKGHTPTVVGRVEPTETEPGYTGDTVCADCGKLLEKGHEIPATGKNDDDNAEAPELRVVVPGNTLRDLLFTVRQADGERTYTCKKADATLTGTLETLQYLQANGTETIVFVTNGRVSRFAVADLLALCNEGDVFYLCHTADAEPTLLIIANDHTELLNK